MLKIALAAIAAISLAACATSSRIVEPERSEYFYFCLNADILVTTCECMEATAVEKTGTTAIGGGDPGRKEAVEFIQALNEALKECSEKTQKLIDSQKS